MSHSQTPEYKRAHYAKHKERYLKRASSRYLDNKSEILAKSKSFYESNRELVLSRNRERRSWATPGGRATQKAYYDKNKDKIKAYKKEYKSRNATIIAQRVALKKYGITPEDKAAMFDRQGGRCAICLDVLVPRGTGGMSIDHCHETGDVRGLLCRGCNQGLGHFRDSEAALENAIKYLRHHRESK